MSSGGMRVSMLAMSPPAEATVSVSTRGGSSPVSGIGLEALTLTAVGAPSRRRPTLVTARMAYLPAFGNGTRAA
jgi:hypothetical protein